MNACASTQLKHLAENAACAISGVKDVQNQLRVQSSPHEATAMAGGSASQQSGKSAQGKGGSAH